MTRLTPLLLVLLRLAIGWHFLFEGMEKFQSDTWTSAGYLREASGPAAPLFHGLAGDPVIDRMEVPPLPAGEDPARTPTHRRLPPALLKDWQQYFDRFAQYYELTEPQRQEAETRFIQRQDQTALWLIQGKKMVKRTSPYGPPVEREMTTPERVQEYKSKAEKVRKILTEEMPRFGPDVNARLQAAKAEAGQLRSDLLGNPGKTAEWSRQLDAVEKASADQKKQLADLGALCKECERRVEVAIKLGKGQNEGQVQQERQTLAGLRKREGEVNKELKSLQDRQNAALSDPDLSKQTDLMKRYLREVLTAEQRAKEPLPEPIQPAWRERSLLQWSDYLVKYGLIAVGICLILGLFTRTACIAGATFLLLFYLAMPALPWVPENPKAEGHYLFINKNIIEMLTLLVLATTSSGRWVGLDGLLQFLNPWRWRTTPAPEPQPLEPPPIRRVMPRDLGAAASRPDLGETEILTAPPPPPDNSKEPETVTAPTSIPKETSDGH